MSKFMVMSDSTGYIKLVYLDKKFVGTCSEHFGMVVFQQYSNPDVIYDREIAKEYLMEIGVLPETFVFESGDSTKTQRWFRITGQRSTDS
jgi:hypothetical protein